MSIEEGFRGPDSSIFLLEINHEIMDKIKGFWGWSERKPIAHAIVNVRSEGRHKSSLF